MKRILATPHGDTFILEGEGEYSPVTENTLAHERRFQDHDHRVAINYGDSWRSLTKWRVERYAGFAHPSAVY